MNCPNCGTYNESTSRFCMKCGQALSSVPVTAADAPAASPPPAQTLTGWTPAGYAAPPPAQYSSPQFSYAPQPGYAAVPFHGASGRSGVGLWGPFAGYGARRRHVGWLMDGEGHRAPDLQAQVDAKFKAREIPGAFLYQDTLVAQGVFVETRRYFIIRRGLASLALYIAPFGKDLFISQASYLKPPISNVRAIAAGVMLLVQGYMTFFYPATLAGAANSLSSFFDPFGGGSGFGAGPLIFLACVLGPLGGLNALALTALLCFSAYKWLTEKDFLAALRVPPNEFNEDDLMAMEKAVEETVRQSLDGIGLNSKKLIPMTSEAPRRLI